MKHNEQIARAIDDAASAYEGIAQFLRGAAKAMRKSGDAVDVPCLVEAVKEVLNEEILGKIVKAALAERAAQSGQKTGHQEG